MASLGVVCVQHAAVAVQAGEAAPPFTLPGLHGEATIALADVAGSVVLLDFWASWCAPCREALPFYSGLHDEFSDRGLAVLAVNVDEHVEDAHRFLDGRALRQPMLRDAQGEVAWRYRVSVMPAAFLIDRRGVVRRRYVGFDATHATQTRALLLDLLAETASEPNGGYTAGDPGPDGR